MDDEKLALDVLAVSRLLGLSKNTLYTLIAENKLPHIRLNGRIIIPRDALMKWLATTSQPTRVPVA